MDKLEFFVSGSRGDVYTIKFEKAGSNLNAYCTWEAGQNGIYCKHRFALMNGEYSSLLSENIDDLPKLKTMMEGTDVEIAFLEVIKLEKIFEMAKADLQKAKKNLARAMYR